MRTGAIVGIVAGGALAAGVVVGTGGYFWARKVGEQVYSQMEAEAEAEKQASAEKKKRWTEREALFDADPAYDSSYRKDVKDGIMKDADALTTALFDI
jgi:hypothetical protein